MLLPLLYATSVSAGLFNPLQAERAWNRVQRSDSQGAAAVQQWCGLTGMDGTQCANTFASGNRILGESARQASINCMSMIETKQEQTAALLDMLNVDTSRFSQFASGSSVSVNDFHTVNGRRIRKDYSPADRELGSRRAAEFREKDGSVIYAIAEISLFVNTAILEFAVKERFGKVGEVVSDVIGGEAFGDLIDALMPDKQEFIDGWKDSGAAEGYENPGPWVKESEMTGTCEFGKPTCTDANGKEYINSNYENEKDSTPPEEDEGPGFDQELNTDPILDEIDKPGDGDGGKVEGTVEFDPEMTDPDAFLKQCVEKESLRITRVIGSTLEADDKVPPLLSDADQKAQAEKNLRAGICDKKLLGEEYCRKWEMDRRTEEGDLEFQAGLKEAFARNLKACPAEQLTGTNALNPSPCWKAKQKFLMRFAADPAWNVVVESAFDTIMRKVKNVVPIRVGDIAVPKAIQAQTDPKPGFGKPVKIPVVSTPPSPPSTPGLPGLGRFPGFHVGGDARITFRPHTTGGGRPQPKPTGVRTAVVVVTGLPGQEGSRTTVTVTLPARHTSAGHDEL